MILPQRLYETVQVLSHEIGVRLAGSKEEESAASYMEEQFRQIMSNCSREEFPVLSQHAVIDECAVLCNDAWHPFQATLYNGAPTTDGMCLEAPLVFFDSHTDYQRTDLSFLNGKAVIHFGSSFPDDQCYARMMAAKPAFLLMVDTRYLNEVPLNDGLIPAYVARHGAIPTLSISYRDAWKWCADGMSRARIQISGHNENTFSQNVIAELQGTAENANCIYVGCHIDSVAGSPGADDNAIGCAIVLEIARELCKKPHRNSIRFVCFGSEEQLSVGSSAYVRRHRTEIENHGRFMINFDSCGSLIGWNRFIINAEKQLRQMIKEHFMSFDLYYSEQLTPEPCNDLFPFTVFGVPGLTVMRSNCEAGKFFHHRYDNDLAVISFDIAAKLAEASAMWIEKLADCEADISYSVEKDHCSLVQKMWETGYCP